MAREIDKMVQMAGAFSQPGPLVRLSEMSDRDRTCQSGRVTHHPDVQSGPTTRQTPFSGRGDVPLSRHTVSKFPVLSESAQHATLRTHGLAALNYF